MNLALNRHSIVVYLLFMGYALQYNPYFLSEYLWKDYWTGSGIRTSISLFFLALSSVFIITNYPKIRKASMVVSVGMFATGCYGLSIGLLLNDELKYIFGDSIFWFETSAYVFLLGALRYRDILYLIRLMVVYTTFSAIISIVLFWNMKDQIAVAALVGGERIVRLADLQAPLVLILLYLRPLEFSRKFTNFGTLVLSLIILLGFFRSVWAAFFVAMVVNLVIYPRLLLRKKVIAILGAGLCFVLIFEWTYYYLTGVKSVLTGRVIAGVGTADSIGRLTSTLEVVYQFSDDTLKMIFGNGFGAMVWFVNDFGDGEVRALQPVGSLSNFFVSLLYEVGFIWFFILFSFFILSAALYWRTSTVEVRRISLILLCYLALQWLTFPSPNHFPVGMTLGCVIALFGYKTSGLSLNNRRLVSDQNRASITLS